MILKNNFPGIVRLPTTLIPVLLVDRLGRRPLLIGSTFTCFVSLGLLTVAIDIGPSWKVSRLLRLSSESCWCVLFYTDWDTGRPQRYSSDKCVWNRLHLPLLRSWAGAAEHSAAIDSDTDHVRGAHENRDRIRVLPFGQRGMFSSAP